MTGRLTLPFRPSSSFQSYRKHRWNRSQRKNSFSFGTVTNQENGMGEHIPTTLWSASDYSVLYGLIFDSDEDLDITEDS